MRERQAGKGVGNYFFFFLSFSFLSSFWIVLISYSFSQFILPFAYLVIVFLSVVSFCNHRVI